MFQLNTEDISLKPTFNPSFIPDMRFIKYQVFFLIFKCELKPQQWHLKMNIQPAWQDPVLLGPGIDMLALIDMLAP